MLRGVAERPPVGRTRGRAWRALVRAAAAVLLLAALVVASAPLWIDALGGASSWRAVRGGAPLSPAARELLARSLEGLDPRRWVDVHTHLAGVGRGSGCWVNPHLLSPWHPFDHVRFRIYLSAAGLPGPEARDADFVEALTALTRAGPAHPRRLLLAFDHRYRPDGTADLEGSEFHVPNEYVQQVVRGAPELFAACVSIHPYRSDALAELERWAARGVRWVKWLPNAMGIDPASERCDAFYAAMAAHGMVLLTHTGDEAAVRAGADQALGNPLRLRRALAAGVRVVAAHCASTGEGEDLDRPGERRPNFELFLRLMDEPRWEGRLFGEISTVTQVNRFQNALATLLRRGDLHARLVDGSDWPLPGVAVLYRTRALERAGFLTADERAALDDLCDFHPLLFDLALKRTVHAPESGERFDVEAFLLPEELLP